MRVLISNNTGREARKLLAHFSEQIGHIIAPRGWREPFPYYAIDNGAFADWNDGKSFSSDAFYKLCARAQEADHAPQWLAVPDVIGDIYASGASWGMHYLRCTEFDWPLAFVVQPGMTAQDVPSTADVVFVGGGDAQWKRATVRYWCEHFKRVHVGGINSASDLWLCHLSGAESCDGTGWFRGDRAQLDRLWHFLADVNGVDDRHDGPLQSRLALGGAR